MHYLATEDGIYSFDTATTALTPLLVGKAAYHIVAGECGVFASGVDNRLWQLANGRWKELTFPGEAAIECLLLGDDGLLAGTEPTRVYHRAIPRGRWKLIAPLDSMSLSRSFHTPWGGPAAVRSMAASPEGMVFLDIHVGGIVRSSPGNGGWEPVNDGLEEDVHQVATHPLRPDRVYAATADGFYLSENRGDTWKRRNRGMTNLYGRGIAIHPTDPDLLLMSGSPDSPGRGWERHGPRFALFRSENAGRSWKQATGLPTPCSSVIDTHCIAFDRSAPDSVIVGLDSGELYVSKDAGLTWSQSARLAAIHAVC